MYLIPLDSGSYSNALDIAASGTVLNYAVSLFTAKQQLLGQYSAYSLPVSCRSISQPPQQVLLTFLPGVVNQAQSLWLIDTNAPTVPLAALQAGLTPPTVSLQTPVANTVFSNQLTASWFGYDPDGDTLHYTLRYSADNGATWRVIVDETPETSTSFSTAGLPGGSNSCLVQVTASDGLHTATVTSAPFTVLRKPPQAYLSFETPRGRSGPLSDAFAQPGDTVVLHASGYDDDDGPLTDSAFNWYITLSSAGKPIQTLNGSGSRFELRDAQPGVYAIKLMVTDSDKNLVFVQGTLHIDPKYVPQANATEVMQLDGYGDETGYLEDIHPMPLLYSDAQAAIVRMVQSSNQLFVCFGGLPFGSNATTFVAVSVGNSDSQTPQTNDLRFQVYANGQVVTLHGDGQSSFVPDPEPVGLQAEVSAGGSNWTAELAIDLSVLGGWKGQTNSISVGHFDRNYIGDSTLWPSQASATAPVSWATSVLGPNLDDPYDGDGDGMPDQWELKMFGTTNRDGTGDFDKDGMTDYAEYVAGTDPTNPLSYLALQCTPQATGGYKLSWPSAPGRSYTVQRSTALPIFFSVAPAIPSAGTQTFWVDPAPPSGGAVFYRLQVQYWR